MKFNLLWFWLCELTNTIAEEFSLQCGRLVGYRQCQNLKPFCLSLPQDARGLTGMSMSITKLMFAQ